MLTTIEKRMIRKGIKEKPPEEQAAIATGIMTPILLNEIRNRLSIDEVALEKISADMLDKLYEP